MSYTPSPEGGWSNTPSLEEVWSNTPSPKEVWGNIPSLEEVEKVRKYIEFCIMHYKTKSQTVGIIARQANVPPVFTETVWEELERQNPDFFMAYYNRLTLIEQIKRFNSLLEVQARMMQEEEQRSTVTEEAVQVMQNGDNGSRQEDEGHSSAPQCSTVTEEADQVMQNGDNGSEQENGGHSSALQPNASGGSSRGRGRGRKRTRAQPRSRGSQQPPANGSDVPRQS